MNALKHHGIKGQRWGVRRYQNQDGTLTIEGKKRLKSVRRVRSTAKTKNDVDNILNTMNKDDLDKVLAGSNSYLSIEEGEYVCKRILKKIGDKPIAFFDVLDDGDSLNLAMGTRSGKKYRGKGYGSEVAREAMNWIDKNSDKLPQKKVVWGVRKDNAASIAIAKKNGFEFEEGSENNGWVNYVKPIKKKNRRN